MTDSEGGVRPQRVEFIRESTVGAFPSDPSYEGYSNNIVSTSWSPTPGSSARRGIGSPTPNAVYDGPEEHDLEIVYDLKQGLLSGGSPQDAAADGIQRASDNSAQNTHGVLMREEINSIPSTEVVDAWGDTGQESGSPSSKDTRSFLVAKGGYVASVSLEGDPGSQQPVLVTLGYTNEKVREYQVDQPSSSTTLTVASTDANDTSQTLTIENEDAGTSEDVALNGTTQVTTTGSFGNIDAAHLSAECAGDVWVSDGTEVLLIIRGQNHYNHGEGDLGVPALGSGSHATDPSTDEVFIGDTLERPTGTTLAYEINSVAFSVENDLDTREQHDTPRMAISMGDQTITVDATVAGPSQSMQTVDQALGSATNDLVWTLDNTTLTAGSAWLDEPASIDKDTGQAARSLGNTFQAQSVTVT